MPFRATVNDEIVLQQLLATISNLENFFPQMLNSFPFPPYLWPVNKQCFPYILISFSLIIDDGRPLIAFPWL